MSKRVLITSFLVALFMLCLSGINFGQEETAATITGQVTDSSGASIPNATVVIANTETGMTRQVQSNEEGIYTVSPLMPGRYTIKVEQKGFKGYVQNITLNVRDRP